MTDLVTAALGCPAARAQGRRFVSRQTPVRPLVIPTRERSEPGGTCFSNLRRKAAQDRTSARVAVPVSRKGRPKIARQFTGGNERQKQEPRPGGMAETRQARHPDERAPPGSEGVLGPV
jgi:hypothetical protein